MLSRLHRPSQATAQEVGALRSAFHLRTLAWGPLVSEGSVICHFVRWVPRMIWPLDREHDRMSEPKLMQNMFYPAKSCTGNARSLSVIHTSAPCGQGALLMGFSLSGAT